MSTIAASIIVAIMCSFMASVLIVAAVYVGRRKDFDQKEYYANEYDDYSYYDFEDEWVWTDEENDARDS